MASTGTVGDIYDSLVEGNSVAVEFPTQEAFFTFRTKLYNHKARFEPEFIMLEVLTEEQTLSISRNPKKPDNKLAYLLKLIPKLERTSKYVYEVISDPGLIPEQLKD